MEKTTAPLVGKKRRFRNEETDDVDARYGAGLRHRGDDLCAGQEGRYQEGQQEEEGQEEDGRREKGRAVRLSPFRQIRESRVLGQRPRAAFLYWTYQNSRNEATLIAR